MILSGQNFYITEYGTKVKVGMWSVELDTKVFDYCKNKNCKASSEHEYAFDGQVFYRKKS